MSLVHLKIKSLLNFIFPFSHHIIVRYYFTKTHSKSNECLCHSTPSHPPHPQHAQATSISHSLSLSLAVCVCVRTCVCMCGAWRGSYLAGDSPPLSVSPLPAALEKFSPQSKAFFSSLPVRLYGWAALALSHSTLLLSLSLSLTCSLSLSQHRCQGCACLPTLPVGVLQHPLLPTATVEKQAQESEIERKKDRVREKGPLKPISRGTRLSETERRKLDWWSVTGSHSELRP